MSTAQGSANSPGNSAVSMMERLQPIVAIGQQLIIKRDFPNMQPMVVTAKDAQKKAFAERLHEAITHVEGAPAPGMRGRPPWLLERLQAKHPRLKLTSQAVTKWLDGQSIPDQTHLTMICKVLGVSLQWLATGDDPSWSDTKAAAAPRSALYSERELLLLQAFRNADPVIQQAAEKVLDSVWQEAPQPSTGGAWHHASGPKK